MIPEADKEVMLSSKVLHQGAFLTIRLDEVRLPIGKTSVREVVEHPGGAMVLPILDNGKLLLIEQFRYSLGDTLYEFPAGKLDPGEDPFTTVQRELEEETGYEAQHWEKLTDIVTSPGFCNEVIYLYKASGLKKALNPRREEDECIGLLERSVDEVRAMIKAGQITDAKTLVGFLLAFGMVD